MLHVTTKSHLALIFFWSFRVLSHYLLDITTRMSNRTFKLNICISFLGLL